MTQRTGYIERKIELRSNGHLSGATTLNSKIDTGHTTTDIDLS